MYRFNSCYFKLCTKRTCDYLSYIFQAHSPWKCTNIRFPKFEISSSKICKASIRIQVFKNSTLRLIFVHKNFIEIRSLSQHTVLHNLSYNSHRVLQSFDNIFSFRWYYFTWECDLFFQQYVTKTLIKHNVTHRIIVHVG